MKKVASSSSIGFFSVDWVALEAGEIRYSSSGTSLQAMSVLLETIDKLISEDHGAKVGMDRLEKAMRTGDLQVLLFGEKVDISPYLNAAMKKVAPVALTAMRQSMRDESINTDLVLIAGVEPWLIRKRPRRFFHEARSSCLSSLFWRTSEASGFMGHDHESCRQHSPGSHPELLKELEKTPTRERAERLRMLATFGLIHMSQPNLSTTSVPVDDHAPDGEVISMSTAPESKAESRKQSLKSKLSLSV